jgi:hypothetical protein
MNIIVIKILFDIEYIIINIIIKKLLLKYYYRYNTFTTS